MDYKKYIQNVVKNCDIAFLSTLNLDNIPEGRALDNTFNKNDLNAKFELYFKTHTTSPKIAQIKKNNKVSVYYFVVDGMQNMTLFGTLEIVNDKAIKNKFWKDEFSMYYPNGKDDELYGIIKFIPNAYKYYAIIDGDYKKFEGKI